MNNRVWVELLEANAAVTSPYLRNIGECYNSMGYQVEYVYNAAAEGDIRDDIYVVAIASSVDQLSKKGAKHIVFWAQGVWPEESYLRNKSRLRLAVISHVEKQALKNSEKLFLVSNAQLEHYEKKYKLSLREKCCIVPCSNEIFHEESFKYEGKYEHPVFVYAGSLAMYQCIDKMLDAFALAQSICPDAKFLFYTRQQDVAREIIEARGLDNVTLGFSSPKELHHILAKAKYGFVIRDNSVVNRVATPTKISSYIANGVIPIYSSTLQAFEESSIAITRLSFDSDSFAESFRAIESKNINVPQIITEYREYFERNFDLSIQQRRITRFLSKDISELLPD